MRWNVVNFFNRIHRSHRISYINLPQKSMRWIFVGNAVKCGEIFIFTAFTAITAFLTKIHRIHRIFYKHLPKNLDPGFKNNFKLVKLFAKTILDYDIYLAQKNF